MPWTGEQFRERHNKSLTPAEADEAAKIANAILKRTGDERLAIATANKRFEKPHRHMLSRAAKG